MKTTKNAARKGSTRWEVRAFAKLGEGTTTVENGITTYTPNNGWITLKTFDNPGKADNWLMDYVRRGGYSITDFTIRRVEG